MPKYLFFDAKGLINPLGDNTVHNFILDTSKFDLDMQVKLPMWGNNKLNK